MAFISDRAQFPDFMAEVRSQSFHEILVTAAQVARFDSSVLISGETGVGKEIVARFIHRLSSRRNYPMLTINCGALPETLLESELFGHKAGSFTGAVNDRVGMFEQGARGTIFLDEIGDVSKVIQVKLLRVLQEREILRVGENTPRKVDIHIIAATNRQLNQDVKDGNFREDLLYRLRVIEIRVPPLRERPEDIIPLTYYLLNQLARRFGIPSLHIDDDCLDRLRTYSWQGNVRELQNALEHAAILSGDGVVHSRHLPPQILKPVSVENEMGWYGLKSLQEMELDYIRHILQITGGNRAEAARMLGIGPATLWRKVKVIKKRGL